MTRWWRPRRGMRGQFVPLNRPAAGRQVTDSGRFSGIPPPVIASLDHLPCVRRPLSGPKAARQSTKRPPSAVALRGPAGAALFLGRRNKKEQSRKRLLFFQCISGNADAAKLVADVGHQSHIAGTLDGNRQLTLMESAGTGHTAGNDLSALAHVLAQAGADPCNRCARRGQRRRSKPSCGHDASDEKNDP